MIDRLPALILRSVVALILPASLAAQMTVSGRVTSGEEPVRNATVSIPDLGIVSRTTADGQYSFIIRSVLVRGQTVAIVARHSRYGTQSASIVLAGGSVEQDFALAEPAPGRPSEVTPVAAMQQRPMLSRSLDSTVFAGSAGPLDLASALAGRIPGLLVTSSTESGSSPMVFRGIRTFAGNMQPLVVVDGVPMSSSSWTSATQQFGRGGFDFGTPLNDIALDDVASVTLLGASDAVPFYGSRAANGVLLVTTKNAAGLASGIRLGTSLRYSGEAAIRMPSFQSRYGQGLNGQFEFFDGQGGGINDAVDQSWGPVMDGQPIAQHSLTTPRRADVRHWLPNANVTDYFESGRTIDANFSATAARQGLRGRAALNARDVNGVLPNAGVRRVGVSFAAVAEPGTKFRATANFMVTGAQSDQRPGTGFDEINPVAGFTRLGRQVDLGALRSPFVGSQQLNWIYTGLNNPFVQAFENSNEATRTHVHAGTELGYSLGRGLTASLRVGLNDIAEDRSVDVVNGWRGTYATSLGRRDFATGGSERESLEHGERVVALGLTAAPRRFAGLNVTMGGGVERRTSDFSAATTIVDTAAIDSTETGSWNTTAFHLSGSFSRTEYLSVDAAVRAEQSSAFHADLGMALFPSLSVTYDAGRHLPALRAGGRLSETKFRLSLWRAGNVITPFVLRRAYAGAGTDSTPILGVADSTALPERTTGAELSATLTSAGSRVGLDLSLYAERSREVLAPAIGSIGEVSNSGMEAQLRFMPFGDAVSRAGSLWDLVASIGHNRSRVSSLDGVTEVALSPDIWGARLVARTNEPVGAIVGARFLRDSTSGALILSNGLPVAAAGPASVLGSIQPDWAASLGSRMRLGPMELGLHFDARLGGKVFSATNLWGSYAGTLASTLDGRETGITLSGVDSISGNDTTVTVSAQDYYHALGAVHERWVYDASYWKLREARLTYDLPLRAIPGLADYRIRASLVGRNIATGARAPNIDPETALSTSVFQGFEMGQLPGTRSIGFLFSLSP